MTTITKSVASWIKSANGNGQKGLALALEAMLHGAVEGDSTVFAKMMRVDNAAYVKNLKLIAKVFGYKGAKLDTPTPHLVPIDKETPKFSKGMTLDSKALDILTAAVSDKLSLGSTTKLAALFPWLKPAPAPKAEPEPAAEPVEDAEPEVLMLPSPTPVQNSVLDLVLAYMADMTAEELMMVQARYGELMDQRIAEAA